jgi:cyclohexa-1,5-dienecarbonyl-CoA hydratase
VPAKFVSCQYEGGVATLTLERPPQNLMNIEMMEEVNTALLELRDHPELKILLIRGAGEFFCGGVDFTDHTRAKVARLVQVFHRIFETMRLLEVIAVAAVHGDAIGGGFELAIGCNLVLAAESAQFSVQQIDLGAIPLLASVVLPRAIARRKAMEWILTGDAIPASELERFGLVNRVYPDAEFESGVAAFIEKLSSKSGPVLQLARRAQVESYYATYEEALYKVENLYLRNLTSLADHQEGIQAYLEGRPPRWHEA